MTQSTNGPRLIHDTADLPMAEVVAAVLSMQTRIDQLERDVASRNRVVELLVDEAVERVTADLTPEQLDECRQAAAAAAVEVADRIRAEA